MAELASKEEELKNLGERREKMHRDHLDEVEQLKDYLNKRLQTALDDQKLVYENELGNLQRALNEQKNHRKELENRMEHLSNELEHRERDLRQKQEDLAGLRQQIVVIEKNKTNEVEELKAQFDHKKKMNQTEQEIRFSAERSSYETQIMQLQQKLDELENKTDSKEKDINELRNRLEDKARELDNLRAREIASSSAKQQEIDDLKKQLEHTKRLYRVSILFQKKFNSCICF